LRSSDISFLHFSVSRAFTRKKIPAPTLYSSNTMVMAPLGHMKAQIPHPDFLLLTPKDAEEIGELPPEGQRFTLADRYLPIGQRKSLCALCAFAVSQCSFASK
jgi:hypothetical protein